MIYRQEMPPFNYLPETFIFFLLGHRNSFILFIVSSKLQNRARGLSTSQDQTVGTWLLKVIEVHVNVLFLQIRWSPRGYPIPRVPFLFVTGNLCDRGGMGHIKISELGNRNKENEVCFHEPCGVQTQNSINEHKNGIRAPQAHASLAPKQDIHADVSFIWVGGENSSFPSSSHLLICLRQNAYTCSM